MRPSIAATLAAILVAGCTTTRLDPVIVQDTAVVLPTPQPLSLNPVIWRVLPPAGKNPALFAVDDQNYQNLTLNLVEIGRYLAEQKAVITMLKSINDQRSQPTPKAH